MKCRILLADDHQMFREALRMCLESSPNMEVVAEISDGTEVLDGVATSRPDIVCMDFNMPKLNGAQATGQLLAVYPHIKVIAMSAHTDLNLAANMLCAGALGFVDKAQAGSEILEAIEMVNKNKFFLSPTLGIKDISELTEYMMPGNRCPASAT
jgi:DNA-binding NarL/FixJ family response regulator